MDLIWFVTYIKNRAKIQHFLHMRKYFVKIFHFFCKKHKNAKTLQQNNVFIFENKNFFVPLQPQMIK